MYTTNAIESLNSTYKRINRNRNVFPTDMSLLKVLYLSTLKAKKKWSMRAKNWDICLSQFKIMYEGRIKKLSLKIIGLRRFLKSY